MPQCADPIRQPAVPNSAGYRRTTVDGSELSTPYPPSLCSDSGLRVQPSNPWAVRTVYAVIMVQAYILIQTDTGRASDVARTIAAMDGIDSAQAVTGPYDVIVSARASDVDALGQLVVTQVQPVEGIDRTLTCPVIKL